MHNLTAPLALVEASFPCGSSSLWPCTECEARCPKERQPWSKDAECRKVNWTCQLYNWLDGDDLEHGCEAKCGFHDHARDRFLNAIFEVNGLKVTTDINMNDKEKNVLCVDVRLQKPLTCTIGNRPQHPSNQKTKAPACRGTRQLKGWTAKATEIGTGICQWVVPEATSRKWLQDFLGNHTRLMSSFEQGTPKVFRILKEATLTKLKQQEAKRLKQQQQKKQ
mmetsp:Transcript_69308/g.127808  ORF Transcript_69308/g.127808 Transcript_69308/m.127808 type:complete len:222 (+) Transcript_69308:377-1042(+)